MNVTPQFCFEKSSITKFFVDFFKKKNFGFNHSSIRLGIRVVFLKVEQWQVFLVGFPNNPLTLKQGSRYQRQNIISAL